MKKVGLIVVAVLGLAAIVQFFMMVADVRRTDPRILNSPGSNSTPGQASADRVTLIVVSDAEGAPPIEGARVEGMGTGPIRERTGPEGRASLPRGGKVRLRIQAARFAGLHLPIDLSVSEQTVVLKRTGSARFTAIDSDGKPVEGVVIRLTVSSSEPSFLMPGHEPVQTTGADGIAAWENLPPGASCEWTVTSGHPIQPGEGIEHGGSKAIPLEDGRWGMESGGANPFQAKGKFTVTGGGEFALTLKVKKTSTVLCRLGHGPDAEGTARVELWNKGEVPTPSGTFKDHRPERQVDVGVGAAISLPNLTPGSKYIRASWWDAPGRRAYARLNFELAEGETRDLGTLPRITGGTLELKVILQGPPEAIERVEKPARTVIMVSCSSPNDDLSVVDHFEGEVGTPITITGLNGSRAFVSVMPQITFRQAASAVGWRQPAPLELTLPVSGPVEIPLVLEIKHLVGFTVSFPNPPKYTYCPGFLLPADGGEPIHVGGKGLRSGATELRFGGYVLPGEYRILVFSVGELNRYLEGTVSVRPDGTNDFKLGELKTGAILRGRALTKAGNPWKHLLHFRFAGESDSRSIYAAEVDSEGRFMVGGIIPNSRLTAAFFTPTEIVVGGTGSETWVDLTGKD